MALQQWVLIGLILSLVLCTGCLSSPPAGPASPVPVVSPAPTTSVLPSPTPSLTPDRVDQGSPVQVVGSSRFGIVHIALHNITVLPSKLYVLDLSVRNDGRGAISFSNTSLVSIISNGEHVGVYTPETRYHLNESEDPLLPFTLAPGQEKRGTVGFPMFRGVTSMAIYLKDRNWTIYGELFIPDLSKGNQSISSVEYPKNMGMIVHSAVRSGTLLGMNLTSGNRFAVINVSITNHGTADVRIPRENLFILDDRGIALEHGGESETEEVARLFLRFPLVIHPGETRTGPILYIVFPGG